MLQRILSPPYTKRWTKPFLQLFSCSCNGRPNHLSTSAAAVVGDENAVPPKNLWVSENELFLNYPRLRLLEDDCNSINKLNQILSYIFISGLHHNPFVMSRVIYTCIVTLEEEDEKGDLRRDYGALIFSQINKPNIFTWNTMIRAYSTLGNSSKSVIAFRYYTEMLCRGVLPDKYTYPVLLQACRFNFDLGFVKQVHCHAVLLGFDTDLYVENALLNVYMICRSVVDAKELFNKMTERDVVSWTTLISGFVDQGCFEECLLVFNRMISDELNPRPNVATVVSVMSGCANLGSLDHSRGLHSYLEKAGWMEVDVSIRNSLIDAYAKCGSLNFAEQMFREINSHQRDRYSWTAIVAGLAIHGCGKEAIKWFLEMKHVTGMMPDAVMFIAVLSACAHSGLVDEGVKIFESMEGEYGIVPELKHYGCMVDLFARAGLLEYACGLIESMPIEPNLTILGSLLSACRVHNNVELGEAVLKKIETSCEYGGGARVLLSNIYANENRWGEVIHVREGFRGEKMNGKPPGRSWIQVKGLVHEFFVGDDSHPQSRELYMLLDSLSQLLCSSCHGKISYSYI